MDKGFNKTQLNIINGKLDSLIRYSMPKVSLLIKNTLTDIENDVKAHAPIQSGNLRRSIYKDLKQFEGKVYVDTTLTENRPSSKHFNYGRTVEHGRAGRYKTTPYWYRPVKKRLGILLKQLNAVLRDAAMKR